MRSGAFICDAVMVFIPVTLILWYLEITDIVFIGLAVSLVFYLSSSTTEAVLGATAGKFIFGLRARSLRSDSVSARAFLRNVNRLLWFVLPPIDFALGMAMRGDPRQRLLDRAAGTTVVIESERKWHEAHLEKEFRMPPAEESSADDTIAPDGVPTSGESASGEGAAKSARSNEPASSSKEEKCHKCGARLIMLADEKLQCEKCGLIQ